MAFFSTFRCLVEPARRDSLSPRMKYKKPSPFFIVILIITSGAFAWIMWIQAEAAKYQTDLGPQIRSAYGFSHGSPYIKTGDYRVEVFTVYPDAGGILERAGFRNGDIVVSENITGFYKLLYQSKAKEVTVTVVDGGDGPPVEQRKTRVVSFAGL